MLHRDEQMWAPEPRLHTRAVTTPPRSPSNCFNWIHFQPGKYLKCKHSRIITGWSRETETCPFVRALRVDPKGGSYLGQMA